MKRIIYGSLSVLTAMGTVFLAAKAEVFETDSPSPTPQSEATVDTASPDLSGLPENLLGPAISPSTGNARTNSLLQSGGKSLLQIPEKTLTADSSATEGSSTLAPGNAVTGPIGNTPLGKTPDLENTPASATQRTILPTYTPAPSTPTLLTPTAPTSTVQSQSDPTQAAPTSTTPATSSPVVKPTSQVPETVDANPLTAVPAASEADEILSEDMPEAEELPTQGVIENDSLDEDASGDISPDAPEDTKIEGSETEIEGSETDEDTETGEDAEGDPEDADEDSSTGGVPADGTFSPTDTPSGVSPISPKPGVSGGVVPATPTQSAPTAPAAAPVVPRSDFSETPTNTPSEAPTDTLTDTPTEPMPVMPSEAPIEPIAPMAPADPVEPVTPLVPDAPSETELDTGDDFSPEEFSPEGFSPEDTAPENTTPENFEPENFEPENAFPEETSPMEGSGEPDEPPLSGVSGDERLIGEGFTPFQLSYLAIGGGLEAEGIPGGDLLLQAYEAGDIEAEDIVAAGALSKRLGTAASDEADYTKGVDRFLKMLKRDARSSN